MRETAITTKILTWLHEQGCYAIKVHGGPLQTKGIPDILFSWAGRFCGIEVKVPGRKPTGIQQHHIDHINADGGIAFCAHSLEEVQLELEARGVF